MRGHVLPVLQLVLLPICCTATYVWSVLLGHVEAGFPYISDTGTYPPESCLFGLLLDIYATVTAISVYLRWQQIRTFYESDGSCGLRRANTAGLVLGLIAAFGVLLVANFQESNVIYVHLVGALFAFGGGAIYTWIQTVISYKAHLLPGHHACLRHFRAVLSIAITASCVLVVVFASLAKNKRGDIKTDRQGFKWLPSDKGFAEHIISTALEWAMAFMSATFFASFYREFKVFTFTMPVEFTVTEREVKVNGDLTSSEMQRAAFTVATIEY
ncbi:DNA damage-regulated autophagy modulator protein 1-like [Littorina saxatilis]|uniref:CWH43-like N-terminal domain-containing protein n=1 Tax=Littorina saxatilis TaxID=31220 RepID=A0AAN9BBC0_9CAEN